MIKRKKSSRKSDFRPQPGIFAPSTLSFGAPVGIALIALAVFISYMPAINGGFVLDDDLMLTENPNIKAADGLYRFWLTDKEQDYWPMTYTSLWLEWRIWERNSTGYHVTNLILHVAEALLIWYILKKLSIPGAFFAAMIFAVHPVNVESVAWIAQRKNTLAMLFLLLSILWYLESEMRSSLRQNRFYQIGSPLFYWLSLSMFLLAMLSKGSVAVLPVLLLGMVWWLRPLTRWDLLRTSPFFVIAAGLAVVNVWFQTHGTEMVFRKAGFVERVLSAAAMVWFYLYKAIFPIDLAFIYPQWHIETSNPLWWISLLAALAVTAVFWWYRNNWSRPFLFAWGFFCVALVPVLGFTDIGFMRYSLVADRYQHIAIIGLTALLAAGWRLWRERLRGVSLWAATAAAIAAIGACASLTWRQCEQYRDEVTLYNFTLAKNPECWMVHNNLGFILAQTGHPREATEHFQQAVRINPSYAEAQNNLGNLLSRAGKYDEAIEHLQQALRTKKNYAEAHYNLGIILGQTGHRPEAIEHLEQALQSNPDYVDARNNLGVALTQAGRYEEAFAHFERVLRINPNHIDVLINMGFLMVKMGRYQEAVNYYTQALRLKPDLPEVHNNLGVIFLQTGRTQDALNHYQQALQLKPDYVEAYNNLGNALKTAGQYQKAIEFYRQALRLRPDYIEAYDNLGVVLIKAGRAREAIEQFKRALQIKPDFANACNNLALAYAETHQSSQAVATAQKALELARSQGNVSLVKQIENWLSSYQDGLSK